MSLPDFSLPENSVSSAPQTKTSSSYEAFMDNYNQADVSSRSNSQPPEPVTICTQQPKPMDQDLEDSFKNEIEKLFYDGTKRKHFNPTFCKILETAAKFWLANREVTISWDKDEFIEWISEVSFYRVRTAPVPNCMLVHEIKRNFDADKKICARRNELVLSGIPTAKAQEFMLWLTKPSEGFTFTPFPVRLLGKLPEFTTQDEDMIIDFVKSQNALFRESEFVDWTRFADMTGNPKFHPEQVRYKYEKMTEKQVLKRVGKECMMRQYGYLKSKEIVRIAIIQHEVPIAKALSFIKGCDDFDPNDYYNWIMLASKAEWFKCLRLFRNIVRDCASCLNPLKEPKLYYLMFRNCVWSKWFETDEEADLKVQLYTLGFVDTLVMTDTGITLSSNKRVLLSEEVGESLRKLYPLIIGKMQVDYNLNAFDAAVYKCIKDRESLMTGRAKLFMEDNLKSRLFKPMVQTRQLDAEQIDAMIEDPPEQPFVDSDEDD